MFKNLSISARIASGFGVVLALLMLIAVVGYINLNRATNFFTQYRDSARALYLAEQVSINMQAAMLNTRDFILNPSEKAAREGTRNLGELKQGSGALIQAFVAGTAMHGKSLALRADADAVALAFTDIVERQHVHDVFVAQMDVLGPSMDDALTALVANAIDQKNLQQVADGGEIHIHLSSARIDTQKYLRTNRSISAETQSTDEHALEALETMGDLIQVAMAKAVTAETRQILARLEAGRAAYLEHFPLNCGHNLRR